MTAPSTITLDPNLDLAASRPLAQRLVGARGSDLTLDASQVRHLGAQCAQILVSAIATWRCDGATVAITSPTPAFAECARLLGLSNVIPTGV